MKKILFITHETTRTGAPLIVLYFMRWLKLNNINVTIDCLSLSTGDLLEDFKNTSIRFYELDTAKDNSIFQRIVYKLKGTSQKLEERKKLLVKIKEQKYDLVYANSILSLKWGVDIKNTSNHTKLLLHLHELNVSIASFAPNFAKLKLSVNQFICASHLVQNNLLENHGILSNQTKVIYECSDIKPIELDSLKITNKKKFVVGASGSVNLRKGYDLFLCVAKEVKEQTEISVEFNWIGKFSNRKVELEIKADIKKAGLQDVVFFKGEFENPEEEFKKFDIFLMTSREDPFPLVCIEVGNLGKPIICFEGATGTEEVLKEGGGEIVSYLGISKMANEVVRYISNPQKISDDGLVAHQKFKEFTINNQSVLINETIIEVLKSKPVN